MSDYFSENAEWVVRRQTTMAKHKRKKNCKSTEKTSEKDEKDENNGNTRSQSGKNTK